jgi:hypothetical protein
MTFDIGGLVCRVIALVVKPWQNGGWTLREHLEQTSTNTSRREKIFRTQAERKMNIPFL